MISAITLFGSYLAHGVCVKSIFLFLMSFVILLSVACGKKSSGGSNSGLDNFDPQSPDAEKELEKFDKEYEEATGKSSHIPVGDGTCYRLNCHVFAFVDKETQTLSLYIDGQLSQEWKVSSGIPSRETPDFDKRPNGRIYDAYTSKKFPGGDFDGLGNMPYAVFIQGGYAIHGTGRGSWKKLGKRASHGCIRLHPDNAKLFNSLVRQYGVANTWITVQ
jgi:hypothetical protein